MIFRNRFSASLFLMGLCSLLIAPSRSQAGLAGVKTIVGRIGDFDQQTVEIKDAKGVVWAVDRVTFRKDYEFPPGAKVRVRVTPDHVHRVDKSSR